MTIVEKLKAYRALLNKMYAIDRDLRTISRDTFAMRNAGYDIPYMAIDVVKDNQVTRIIASPTAKQKEYAAFFAETAPGCKALPRFEFYMDETGAHFEERFGRGTRSEMVREIE